MAAGNFFADDKVKAIAATGENPWWDDPARETSNTTESHTAVERYIAQDKDLNRRFLFFIAKTGNRTCVCYFYNPEGTDATRIVPKWVLVDKEERRRYCEERKIEDKDQLILTDITMLEKTVYGTDSKVFARKDPSQAPMVKFTLAGLASASRDVGWIQVVKSQEDDSYQCLLKLKEDTTKHDVVARLDHAYVQCCKGKLPDVEYIHVYGTSIQPPYDKVCETFRK